MDVCLFSGFSVLFLFLLTISSWFRKISSKSFNYTGGVPLFECDVWSTRLSLPGLKLLLSLSNCSFILSYSLKLVIDLIKMSFLLQTLAPSVLTCSYFEGDTDS